MASELLAALADDLEQLIRLHDRELDAETLAALRSADFPHGLALPPAGEAGQQAYANMAAALTEPASLDELAADYAAIYLTHALRASPFESVWRDEDHLAMQNPTFSVRAFYRRHSMQVTDWRKLADDHLTHELNFLALLLERGEQREAARFLGEHLMTWLPDFAQRVGARAATPFYAALAVLTRACCAQCQRWLPRVALMPAVQVAPPPDAPPGCGH